MLGQQAGQRFGILQNCIVQVAGVRRQNADLAANGAHHVRVAMPDVRHIVVDVEIGIALRIVEPTRPRLSPRCSGFS